MHLTHWASFAITTLPWFEAISTKSWLRPSLFGPFRLTEARQSPVHDRCGTLWLSDLFYWCAFILFHSFCLISLDIIVSPSGISLILENRLVIEGLVDATVDSLESLVFEAPVWDQDLDQEGHIEQTGQDKAYKKATDWALGGSDLHILPLDIAGINWSLDLEWWHCLLVAGAFVCTAEDSLDLPDVGVLLVGDESPHDIWVILILFLSFNLTLNVLDSGELLRLDGVPPGLQQVDHLLIVEDQVYPRNISSMILQLVFNISFEKKAARMLRLLLPQLLSINLFKLRYMLWQQVKV